MSDTEERRRGLDPVRAAQMRVRRGLWPFCDNPAAEGCCCPKCYLDRHSKRDPLDPRALCHDACPNPAMRFPASTGAPS